MEIEKRKQILENYVAGKIYEGYKVESIVGTTAVIVRRGVVNHGLHFLLSILTVGFWLIIWLIMVLSRDEERTTIAVDENGDIQTQTTHPWSRKE